MLQARLLAPAFFIIVSRSSGALSCHVSNCYVVELINSLFSLSDGMKTLNELTTAQALFYADDLHRICNKRIYIQLHFTTHEVSRSNNKHGPASPPTIDICFVLDTSTSSTWGRVSVVQDPDKGD